MQRYLWRLRAARSRKGEVRGAELAAVPEAAGRVQVAAGEAERVQGAVAPAAPTVRVRAAPA